MAEVYCMNQNIPAPLDMKTLYSLYTLGSLTMADHKVVESFWKELRDEVKWRIENQIAAVGTERYRYVEDEPPPWYFLKYYRYLEKYGAVSLGSEYMFHAAWPFHLREDGSYEPEKTPLDLGWPLAVFLTIGFDGRENRARFRHGLFLPGPFDGAEYHREKEARQDRYDPDHKHDL